MKIVIPGGAGHLGHILSEYFTKKNHEIVVLTRDPKRTAPGARSVQWDAKTLEGWTAEIDGADAVINLTGRSVECRYTEKNRREIMNSRVDSTRVLGEAIAKAANPPKVWLNASTSTIYAHTYGDPHDEESTAIGGGKGAKAEESWGFSIKVAKAWEKTLFEAEVPNTRRVALRTSMVMSASKGGAFEILHRLAKFGLGGAVCGGRQYMSWMHEEDFVRVLEFLIERDDIDGIVNLAAPNPLPQKDFMAAIRKAVAMPIALPAFRWQVELGAWALGSEPELILKSRRVISKRLKESGFQFNYPKWKDAAKELCGRM